MWNVYVDVVHWPWFLYRYTLSLNVIACIFHMKYLCAATKCELKKKNDKKWRKLKQISANDARTTQTQCVHETICYVSDDGNNQYHYN